MNGYWRAEAVDQTVDSFVLWKLLKQSRPKLYEHLLQNKITPDTFIQKWFGGLGVQIIPIQHLIGMWSQYFKYGYRYLFKFYLSMLEQLEPYLLQTKEDFRFYEILRLETKTKFFVGKQMGGQGQGGQDKLTHEITFQQWSDRFFNQVLANANAIGVGGKYKFVDELNFAKEREEAYDLFLQKRLLDAALNNTFLQQLETNEEEEDTNKDCELCDDGFAEYYCTICEKYLCPECHEDGNGDHKLTHEIEQLNLGIVD